jgi:zinc transporter, ZIP family
MPDYLLTNWPYVLLATGAGFAGGLVALFWSPKSKARSAIQHFAAGAVLAAVASNVVPEAERLGTIQGILGGLAAGGLMMLGLKWLVVRLERKEKRGSKQPIGLAAAAAVDTLVDGALIGAGFSINPQLGVLLAFALATELFSLTLSVGVEFRTSQVKGWQSLAVTSGIAILQLVGAFGAGILLEGASEAVIAVVLAFGAAALIYLIAEELLVETIEAEDSLFPTATLFSGFLLLLALKLLSPDNS